jgi:hypothetical protein
MFITEYTCSPSNDFFFRGKEKFYERSITVHMNMIWGYKYNVLGVFLELAKDNRAKTFEAKSNTAAYRQT